MEIQKAQHLHLEEDKKSPNHLGHEYMIFEKHDGWYGYIDFPAYEIASRQHRPIPSVKELSDKIVEKALQYEGRLIFEIMIEGLEIDSFYTLNGILNRKEIAKGVYLQVHDFVPNLEMVALERYELAVKIVNELNLPEVRISPLLGRTYCMEEARTICENLWSNRLEGIILKRTLSTYAPGKRNFQLMKIKEELTLDLEVVGIAAGEGKYRGTVGAIIVKEGDVLHHVSGMTDNDRHSWWANPSEIVGCIVEIKAMKRDKGGKLREPRFKAIRYDKDKPDDSV